MDKDYLWDRSGETDPEIEKLEGLLGRLRHRRAAPVFPEIPVRMRKPILTRLLERGWTPAAALALLIVAISVMAWLFDSKHRALGPAWTVTQIQGEPRLESRVIKPGGGPARLELGQTLETDAQSKASIDLDQIGTVEVEPGTRLRVLRMNSELKRLALEHGTIHAAIWAPPGQFVVDTPSAVAVDLGCAYTLQVDNSGAGLLRTTLGWVGFKLGNHESFIPAGAVCRTKAHFGPGTPYFEDASESFRTALVKLDFESGRAEERNTELNLVLVGARRRDALTLWHLLSRVDPSERGRVFDRLTELVPAPPGVTREGILRGDSGMLDLWWGQLGLGDISLWRHWERSWSDQSGKAR
jgi:FecR-like protein